MWPFRREPAAPEVVIGRKSLPASQLEITKYYGWQPSHTASDQEVWRESLARHEPGLVDR
jgi:hypothetical protein